MFRGDSAFFLVTWQLTFIKAFCTNNTNTCNRHLPLIFGEVCCVLANILRRPTATTSESTTHLRALRFPSCATSDPLHPVTNANRFDILKRFFVCKLSLFVDKHLTESSFAVSASKTINNTPFNVCCSGLRFFLKFLKINHFPYIRQHCKVFPGFSRSKSVKIHCVSFPKRP